MKAMYKGFELEVKREQCLCGYPLLYFTIYQDGYEHVCTFEDSNEKVRDKINQLKEWVDNYINDINNGICPECGESLSFGEINDWYCEDCDEYFKSQRQ